MIIQEEEREFRFDLLVAGEMFFTGDEGSIGVLYANLNGRNFDRKAEPAQEHQSWLEYMALEYGTALPLGAKITMRSPEGKTLRESKIGAGLPLHA